MTANTEILVGDCLDVLPLLPAGSVHCVVTSPPYWGLRDYGTATWVGGDPACDHRTGRFTRGGLSPKQASNRGSNGDEAAWVCPKCGALRVDRQIGLEPIHDCLAWARGEPPCGECYVCKMRLVAKELWRVLRDDGTFWLNLGDTYAGSRSSNNPQRDSYGGLASRRRQTRGQQGYSRASGNVARAMPPGLKPKDLAGIPWRVAFALQADGWYLRSDVVWAKPNAMPESVRDRPTQAHEYVFLLTKSERYWYDADAIAERAVAGWRGSSFTDERDLLIHQNAGRGPRVERPTRNCRSVWVFPTRPYNGAHFAVFPPDLPKLCILAGCPPLACSECGRGWERGQENLWEPACECGAEAVPGVVLDPFAGSGTTGEVAARLGRRAILIELNPDYLPLIRKRVGAVLRQPHLPMLM